MLRKQSEVQTLFTTKRYGKNHDCIFEGVSLMREFVIERRTAVCSKDFAIYHLRWTNADDWVREEFTCQVNKPPMFWLRNKPENPKSLGLSYPERPQLHGHHLEW